MCRCNLSKEVLRDLSVMISSLILSCALFDSTLRSSLWNKNDLVTESGGLQVRKGSMREQGKNSVPRTAAKSSGGHLELLKL